MTDIVYIRELEVETVIGIYAWERECRQTVSIDLDLAWDLRPAAASGRIEDALDYKAVAKRVARFVGAARCHLVETLAERIAAIILAEFQVPWLRLRVGKPGAVTGSRDVGVVIERGRRPPPASGA